MYEVLAVAIVYSFLHVTLYLQNTQTDTDAYTDNPLVRSPVIIFNTPCKASHSKGTGYGLPAGVATVGLFKQNGTIIVLNLP